MLSRFPTEKINVHKESGEIIPDITALVDLDHIFIEDTSVVIEEGDFFERTLPQGAKEYYLVKNRGFFKGNGSIQDHYQCAVSKLSFNEIKAMQTKPEAKQHKLFISHSSKDLAYIHAFVELLEDIGMADGSIVCTSVPGHGIPGGEKIYDWLRNQFLSYDLRVVFVLSSNYYNSPACLNEMGAAWITKSTDTLLLLPGFGFKDIEGCIDPTEVGIKLDAGIAELCHRLNELKDVIIEEYQLPAISQTRWERYRNSFVDRVQEISKNTSEESSMENQVSLHIVKAHSKNTGMTNEAQIMLLYAADGDGTIIVSNTLSGSTYQTGGNYNMNGSQTPREIAKWEAAVQALQDQGYISLSSNAKHTYIYQVTHKGYTHSDGFKNTHRLDTSKTPSATLLDLLAHYQQQDEEQEQETQEMANFLSSDPYH